MTTDDTRQTIGERYGIATTSSNLRPSAEKTTPLDLIHAAGIVQQRPGARAAPGMGVLLLRLQAEYDAVKGELEQAQDAAQALERQAKRIERAGDFVGDDGVMNWGSERLATFVRRSEGEILTARCLILAHLRTLREAKQAVGAYALILATRVRYMQRNDVVMRLAGRVLDVHLDPTCHKCDGTGSIGSGYLGEVETMCRACGGSGLRRDKLGADDRAQWFAFTLLGDIQTEMSTAERSMRAVSSNKEKTV